MIRQRCNGGYSPYLILSGLTNLSDAAAESLSKHEGHLSLNGLKSCLPFLIPDTRLIASVLYRPVILYSAYKPARS